MNTQFNLCIDQVTQGRSHISAKVVKHMSSKILSNVELLEMLLMLTKYFNNVLPEMQRDMSKNESTVDLLILSLLSCGGILTVSTGDCRFVV